jgi:hypothetical protein
MFENRETALEALILRLTDSVLVPRGKDEIEPLKELKESKKMRK